MRSRNEIKANVMYDWDANAKRTKFGPGDSVKVLNVDYRGDHSSEERQATIGKTGKVIAVTTTGNGKVRGRDRMYTRYYVEFQNGQVHGFHSHFLEKVVELPKNSDYIINNEREGMSMKRYAVTENEIRENLSCYNEDMLAEIDSTELFRFLKGRLAKGMSTTLADVDEKFPEQAMIIDPDISTIQLIKEFPGIVLPMECINDLEDEIDFEVILMYPIGTYNIIPSDELDY